MGASSRASHGAKRGGVSDTQLLGTTFPHPHWALRASLRHNLFLYLCNELHRTLWTMVVARLVGKPHTASSQEGRANSCTL